MVNNLPVLVGSYLSVGKSIRAGHGTRPVRVFAASTLGARVHQQFLSCGDSADNEVQLYHLEKMTLQSDMSTGTLVDGGGSDDTITRGGGSFLTDGWKIGDLLFVHGATTLANDFAVRITGVVALTLTFATATVNTGEVLPSGAILYRATPEGKMTVLAGSGLTAGVPVVNLLDDAQRPELDASPRRYDEVGPLNAMAVALTNALGSTEFADVTTKYANY